MTHSTATAHGKPTPRGQIRKTVAGRALPAPVNRVWGVYDPHPFSRFIFDPASSVLKKFGNPGFPNFLAVSPLEVSCCQAFLCLYPRDGLADSWSEEEIWQGLSSLANRKKVHVLDSSDHVPVIPKTIIIVDGIDESSLHDRWIERVQQTNTIVRNYPTIRFCFMSRPYVFNGKNTGGKIVNIDVNGDVPTYKLFDSYAIAYDVDVSSAGWVKYALTTPLALKLFCELNKGKKINYHSGADVSIAALLKEKIRMLESEYCKQDSSATIADQNIFRAILMLANSFSGEARIERNQVIGSIAQILPVDNIRAQKLAGYLENFGILRLYCEHGSGLLSPDVYYYYPGIQGYFDYASALMLIDEYKTPQNIDFP